jgi:hypothetical protein
MKAITILVEWKVCDKLPLSDVDLGFKPKKTNYFNEGAMNNNRAVSRLHCNDEQLLLQCNDNTNRRSKIEATMMG